MDISNEIYIYIAGFFDGEGCIGAYVDKTNQSKIRLMTFLTNTNLEILIKMKQVFGGSIIKNKKKKINHKDSWNWNIYSRNELKMLFEKIIPYSIVKRQQLEYGLKYLDLTSDSRGNGHGTSSEEQKIRQFFSDKLKEMKHTELSDDELKMFAEQIQNMNIDKNQSTMEDY